MASNRKTKVVYFLITEKEVYRSDEVLNQIDEWIAALKIGKLVRVEPADLESLDEYEAHLTEAFLENKKLKQEEANIDF